MNSLLRISLLYLGILLQPSGMAQNPGGENGARTRLVNGLYNNDENAFNEVSKLPLDQAVPMLSVYVNDASTNRERAIRARDTLRKMPGFSSYMKQRILEKRSKGGGEYDMIEFRLLGAIGGDEAAAATAPFLFVDDPTLLVADDYAAGPINSMALSALVAMHLPDGPKDKAYTGYTAPDIEEWKAWAEKRGYRDQKIPPLITLQQKGVSPVAITRSEAILAAARPSATVGTSPAPVRVQHQTPAPTNASSVPVQSATPESSPPLAPVTQPPAVPVERKAPVWPWVISGIAALTVIALLVWKRRTYLN